jgi:hypothetical protein
MVTPCPLCHTVLDGFQREIEKDSGTELLTIPLTGPYSSKAEAQFGQLPSPRAAQTVDAPRLNFDRRLKLEFRGWSPPMLFRPRTTSSSSNRCSARIDGFRNILRDPRIALLFLIPGVGETLRVNGRAVISIDSELMQSFAVNGKLPRSVLIVHIETIFFHCSKAIVRSKLWDEKSKIDRKSLPSTGTIIAELSQGKLGGESYDREAPEKIKAQLY